MNSSTTAMPAPAAGRATAHVLPASVPGWRAFAYAISLLFAVAWTVALERTCIGTR